MSAPTSSAPAASAPSAASTLTPAQRAQVIYTQARSEMSDKLWRAALGGGGEDGNGRGGADALGRPRGLDSLLGLFKDDANGASGQGLADPRLDPIARLLGPTASLSGIGLVHGETGCVMPALGTVPEGLQGGYQGQAEARRDNGDGAAAQDGETSGALDLHGGPNARYAPMLREAASRTGLPPAALATIVHAEAARAPDGRWLAYSRNPRSSAAGLGQFLNGTWISEAERAGTWLHEQASARGWLNAKGRVTGADRGALLALRYDAQASIEATADFARANLDAFQRAGIDAGHSVEDVARTAYLGHHLGRGDAIKFLTGQLDPGRARTLLDAQIGRVEAAQRIASAGSAVAAHRSWLLGYVDRAIRPERFQA